MVSTAVLGFVLLVAVYSVAPSEAKLSNDQQEEILKAHNFYRSKVSPIATNMAALVRLEEAISIYTPALLYKQQIISNKPPLIDLSV